jgi:cellulose synthase/poly-beta-1,6-N-acetylglucosamine synthase-like glycosyltransferase
MKLEEPNLLPEFQIIIPVFNEERVISDVLNNVLQFGYLHQLVVVNDASTDGTSDILDYWSLTYGLRVIHLSTNAKKEGAILQAIEFLQKNNELKAYTILLDADTRLQANKVGESVCSQICKAIKYLEENNFSAMALRVNAAYFKFPTIYWMSAYSTYFGLQFDCWLLGLQKRLWVINGAGGLFKSNQLLSILKGLIPNFETGDLQITVELMKSGGHLCLYNDIIGLTYVPESLVELFNQRRRWERGTIKVLWGEKRFYGRQFIKPNLLMFALLLHLALYIGVVITSLSYFFKEFISKELLAIVLMSMFAWYVIDVVKSAWVAYKTGIRAFPLFCLCALVNAPVWVLVIIPARLYGGVEALVHLVKSSRNRYV